MQKTYEIYQKQWENELFALPEWRTVVTFGLGYFRKSVQTDSLKKRILNAKKFETEFVQLCNRFGFDPANPKYKKFPLPKNIPIPEKPTCTMIPGELDLLVAKKMAQTLKEIYSRHKELESDLNKIIESNSKVAKYGPLKTPPFFAEFILTGIYLHRESEDGLKLLRTFLQPKGGLEVWLTEKLKVQVIPLKKSILSTLLDRSNSEIDINQWANSKKQTIENTLLEDKHSKKSMLERGSDKELNAIRDEALNHVETIRSKCKL